MTDKIESLVILADTLTSIGEYTFAVLPRAEDWIEIAHANDAATMYRVVKVVHPVTGDFPDIYVLRLGDNHEALDRLAWQQAEHE
ncbi:hypothetical protein WL94_28325 [Burkholderia cepacia]|nr:hypothetical protein WL26_03855 [Burkholderia cepacia]KWF81280.1 hypothetical protein WL94_28325 [Burkholderia cepacia]